MTTNDALTNPLPATPPPLDSTSLPLFNPTLALKMAGHAVAGVLLHCRPRVVSLEPRNGAWCSYRLDPRDSKGARAAMVALGGYTALTIAEMMKVPLAKGFRESALCTDLYLAFNGLPGEKRSREATLFSLLPRVHELLLPRWATMIVVANHLITHRQINGSTLGKIVMANDNIGVSGTRSEDGEGAIVVEPKPDVSGKVANHSFIIETLDLVRSGDLTFMEGLDILQSQHPMAAWALMALSEQMISVELALRYV